MKKFIAIISILCLTIMACSKIEPDTQAFDQEKIQYDNTLTVNGETVNVIYFSVYSEDDVVFIEGAACSEPDVTDMGKNDQGDYVERTKFSGGEFTVKIPVCEIGKLTSSGEAEFTYGHYVRMEYYNPAGRYTETEPERKEIESSMCRSAKYLFDEVSPAKLNGQVPAVYKLYVEYEDVAGNKYRLAYMGGEIEE